MTLPDYEPRGSTPLLDAIGECIRRAEPVKGADRAVTTVIITDGAENASKEFTKDAIRALVKQKEGEGWTFVFIGAEIDAYTAGSTLGMNTGATVSYNKAATGQMFTNTAGVTLRRSADNRMHGVMASSVMSFYTDIQKAAMGDTTVDPATVVVPTGTAIVTPAGAVTGGPGTVPATFPPKVDNPKRRPRDWKATSAGK